MICHPHDFFTLLSHHSPHHHYSFSFSRDLQTIYYAPHTICCSHICSSWTLSATSCLPVCAFQLLSLPLPSAPSPAHLEMLYSARHRAGAASSLSGSTDLQVEVAILHLRPHGMPALPLLLHTTWHLLVHLSIFTSTF